MSSYGTQKIVKNSIFLKIQQGSPHTIRLLDATPTEQWQHNIDKKLVSCTGEICIYCGDGAARSQRFVANVYDHTEGRILLWSYGTSIAEALQSIALSLEKDEEDILNHDLEISATGEGMQKKTRIQLRIKSLPVPTGLKKHSIGAKKEDEIPF